MKRRYWGLYDLGGATWLTADSTGGKREYARAPEVKRRRFMSLSSAIGFIEGHGLNRLIIPKEFSAVRKLPTAQQSALKAAAQTLSVHGFKRESTALLEAFGLL
jgi:hypothetical protein